MKPEECNSYKKCSASICPLNLSNSDRWFSSEGICTQYNSPWISAQKKIAKKCRDVTRYFILEMLKRNCIIGVGMVGLDPEKDEVEELKKWMRKHPVKRKLTEEEKAKLREKFKKNVLSGKA